MMNEQMLKRFNSLVSQYETNCLLNFKELHTLDNKVYNIAHYLKRQNINDVVIGISGGVDSAVVFGLLNSVKKHYIPSLKIHGYCITFNEVYGHVFDPKYVKLLRDKFTSDDVTISIFDCSETLKTMFGELRLNTFAKDLLAQSSYALRYQMLFTFAQADNGITIGTTNRDEFEYVGWFGKTSDMVVDLQVITDWHKCEVIQAAKDLNIPQEIIERVPSGDLIDCSSDEDNFGCTYAELAFYSTPFKKSFPDQFIEEKYAKVIQLHKKNAHKYQGQTFNPVFIK